MINSLTHSDIEKYINELVCIFNSEILPDIRFLISKSDDKDALKDINNDATCFISNQLQTIYSLDDLSVALFIVRDRCKKNIYATKSKEWSDKYVVISDFFLFVYNYSQNNTQSRIITAGSDYTAILRIVGAIAAIIQNKSLFDASFYPSEAIDNYLHRMNEVSNIDHDLHKYSISDLSVLRCIGQEKIDTQQIMQVALKPYSKCYMTNKEIKVSSEWQGIIRRYTSKFSGDILRIPEQSFQRLSSRIKKVLMFFSANNCRNIMPEESQFIFTFIHDHSYYISLSVMDITQEMIEKFITWGQYSRVTECFFWN